MNPLKMLTNKETAEIFNISLPTLKMWQETGALLPIRTGKGFMYSQKAIEKFQERFEGYDMSNLVHVIESMEKVRSTEHNN